jgi:hypothetical protein
MNLSTQRNRLAPAERPIYVGPHRGLEPPESSPRNSPTGSDSILSEVVGIHLCGQPAPAPNAG